MLMQTAQGISLLCLFALVGLTGCDRQGVNRQPPPPAGVSVHQSPSQGSPPAPQGSMSVPPETPGVPSHPATP